MDEVSFVDVWCVVVAVVVLGVVVCFGGDRWFDVVARVVELVALSEDDVVVHVVVMVVLTLFGLL